jgi:ABC-2 type transport system permease protein
MTIEARNGSLWRAAHALGKRELVRFFRQKGRVIGAVATPLIIWLFLGFGLGENFRAEGAGGDDYLAYFYPGMIAMLVLFTAIFSAISVIQDRNEGFLQAVLVAPVSPVSIVCGKILGGTVIATLQGALVLALAPLVGIPFHPLAYLASLGVIFLMALGLSALGFFCAWGTDSIQAFHSVMNMVLFPMWLLSGAFFPPEGWLGMAMHLNPLTYGLAALRRTLYLGTPGAFENLSYSLPGLGCGILVMAAFGVGMVLLSALRVRKPVFE